MNRRLNEGTPSLCYLLVTFGKGVAHVNFLLRLIKGLLAAFGTCTTGTEAEGASIV